MYCLTFFAKHRILYHNYYPWTHFFILHYFSEAVGSYAENQQITAVRKVYQRGVVNPMINIEGLWKEYCIYEQVV